MSGSLGNEVHQQDCTANTVVAFLSNRVIAKEVEVGGEDSSHPWPKKA